jgi:hypothetical protein
MDSNNIIVLILAIIILFIIIDYCKNKKITETFTENNNETNIENAVTELKTSRVDLRNNMKTKKKK